MSYDTPLGPVPEEYADLAALAKVLRAEFVSGLELQRSRTRHRGADDGAVQIRVNQGQLAGLEKFFQQKSPAQAGGVEHGGFVRRWNVDDFHGTKIRKWDGKEAKGIAGSTAPPG